MKSVLSASVRKVQKEFRNYCLSEELDKLCPRAEVFRVRSETKGDDTAQEGNFAAQERFRSKSFRDAH